MSLPPFASLDDYTARFGAVSDETAAEAALTDASTDIRSFLQATFVDDSDELDFSSAKPWAADLFIKTTCQVAQRRLSNPDGLTAETVAGYSFQQANSSADTFLTKSEKSVLLRAIGRSDYPVWTMPTTRLDTDDITDTRPVGCEASTLEEILTEDPNLV